MKADADFGRGASSSADSKGFVGHFVRRQGQYGTIAVVARLQPEGVEAVSDVKRRFPRDGQVETHGAHASLHPGDWVQFDIVGNTRLRAPKYAAHNLKRLPRYAELPESTMPAYQAMLASEGWRGGASPGLWAFRLSGGVVIVVDMEVGKAGGLRISRAAAREVKCYRYDDQNVVQLSSGGALESLFIVRDSDFVDSLDWSDEADHIARVVRSLAGVNDPRLTEIITWLQLHHEAGTGRVSAASGDTAAALDALRSGALASRLRADQELMEVYIAAAVQDEAVRSAVADYARQGRGAEWNRLREELDRELAAEKVQLLERLTAELATERSARIVRIEEELARHEKDASDAQMAKLKEAEREVAAQVGALEASLSDRRDELHRRIMEQVTSLKNTKVEIAAAESALGNLRKEADEAREQLAGTKSEIDRLLTIAQRLGPGDRIGSPASNNVGVLRVFPDHPKVDVAAKRHLISRQAILSEHGKEVMQTLVVMLLSGELPILFGDEATDFLRVAETVVCPGRYVSIEADPTLISLDDLWSRPGSGAPTLLASAAGAAKDGGAVLVVIRGIERSGARFWIPALTEALQSGGLPRGLFVCCTVRDREHDEVSELPERLAWLEIVNTFQPEAFATGPALLTQPSVLLETLDPGPMPTDLSAASSTLIKLEDRSSLELAMRVARMFAEATTLLGDKGTAQRLVLNIAKSLASKPSK